MEKTEKLELYRQMLRIRKFEEKVRELAMANVLPGFFHLYIGEEAIAVGVCSALNADDYVLSTHRGHGHLLAKGADMRRAMAELYAKEAGYNKARGGSLHIFAPEVGMLGANGIVGAGIPIATGAAFAAKYRNESRVSVAFFGDGASSEGTFHEALNIGATMALPVIYVCENNLYGVSTKQTNVRKIENVADRAAAYGMPGVIVDGNDVEKVKAVTEEAVERARRGEGPTLIECKTYRHYTHFVGEPDNYRPAEEVRAWKDRDPLLLYAQKLLQDGIADQTELDAVLNAVNQELKDAITFSETAPVPDPKTALNDVYARNDI